METLPLLLTLKLASITTFILLVLALPMAYFLAFTQSKWKPVLEALVSLPLVLPPTVLGFYLLLGLGPNYALGKWLHDTFDLQLVFTFPGLVFASLIYSLPFMVHPIQTGLAKIPTNLIEVSYTLGKSKWSTFIKVMLPNIRPALVTGIVLAFAHTIGEFGVVLMIGGNIPGETQVASIAIYDYVESMNYSTANAYSLLLLGVSFVILLGVYLYNGQKEKGSWL